MLIPKLCLKFSIICLIGHPWIFSSHQYLLNMKASRLRYNNGKFIKRSILSTSINSSQKYIGYKLKHDMKYKYILHYTSSDVAPFKYQGQTPFQNCLVQNCIVTTDRNYFDTNKMQFFDAVVFNGPDIWYEPDFTYWLPKIRYPFQKYIFFSLESSHNYPVCDEEYDNFYNLTWSYKLNSDMVFPYFIIRDSNGNVIGPKTDMHWIKTEDMMPVNDAIKEKIKMKIKAVAWLVSKCKTRSNREDYVNRLADALNDWSLQLDIYGKCSPNHLVCGRPDLMMRDCWELIEQNYYFYLSFENSFSYDYVSEEVLNPLLHYTVPIVYGKANYTRFLPEGAYLDAAKLSPIELAKEIYNIISDTKRYSRFFQWHNHYSYHSPFDAADTNPLCNFCKTINKRKQPKRYYNRFRDWWNEPGICPKNR